MQRGDQWAQTARVTNRVTGNTTRVIRAAAAAKPSPDEDPEDVRIARTGSGDVYAGRDGSVYRRQEGGGWEKYDNGSWSAAERPTPSEIALRQPGIVPQPLEIVRRHGPQR